MEANLNIPQLGNAAENASSRKSTNSVPNRKRAKFEVREVAERLKRENESSSKNTISEKPCLSEIDEKSYQVAQIRSLYRLKTSSEDPVVRRISNAQLIKHFRSIRNGFLASIAGLLLFTSCSEKLIVAGDGVAIDRDGIVHICPTDTVNIYDRIKIVVDHEFCSHSKSRKEVKGE